MIFRGLRGFDPGGTRAATTGKPDARLDLTTKAPAMDRAGVPFHNGAPGAILFRRPLVSISTALALVDADDERQIIEMIEQGKLRWAFDVADGKRLKREVRILGASINEYLTGQQAPSCSAADDFARAIGIIFPVVPATVPTPTIARAFSVSPDHVLNLCRSCEICTVKGHTWHRGPRGAAQIVTASIIAFLKRRRMI